MSRATPLYVLLNAVDAVLRKSQVDPDLVSVSDKILLAASYMDAVANQPTPEVQTHDAVRDASP